MSGRGCYGNPPPLPPGRSSGWLKVIAVAGIGAVAWWWVLPSIGLGAKPRSQSHELPLPSHVPPPPPPHPLDAIARSRGFASAAEYEDALVATARELEASGAKVELGPYLAHLGPRLRDGAP